MTGRRIFILLCLAAVTFLKLEEAQVSQVFYEDSRSTLADKVTWSTDIVIVEAGKPSTEVLKTVVFPKSTHHQKAHDSTYVETVKIYKVKDVLRSGKLKNGDVIKVFEAPDYSEGVIRMEHEQGMLESPIVQRYKPVSPVGEDSEKILLLTVYNDKSGSPIVAKGVPVFVVQAEEGVKSKSQVLDVISGKTKPKAAIPVIEQIKKEK